MRNLDHMTPEDRDTYVGAMFTEAARLFCDVGPKDADAVSLWNEANALSERYGL